MPIYACAVLPDHVHLVMGPTRIAIPQAVVQLKGEATRQLVEEGVHPFGRLCDKRGRPPKCFARGQWKVYLEAEADVRRAIAYVEENPVKEGKRRQRWSFVSEFPAPLPRRGSSTIVCHVNRDAVAERKMSA